MDLVNLENNPKPNRQSTHVFARLNLSIEKMCWVHLILLRSITDLVKAMRLAIQLTLSVLDVKGRWAGCLNMSGFALQVSSERGSASHDPFGTAALGPG